MEFIKESYTNRYVENRLLVVQLDAAKIGIQRFRTKRDDVGFERDSFQAKKWLAAA